MNESRNPTNNDGRGTSPPAGSPHPYGVDPFGYFAPEKGLSLRDYIRILRERWWILAACVLLGVGLSTAMVLRATPIYTASARVQIDPQASRVRGVQDAVTDPGEAQAWRYEEYFNTQIANLRASDLLSHAIEFPEVAAALGAGFSRRAKADSAWAGRIAAAANVPLQALTPEQKRRAVMREAAVSMRVTPVRNTRLVDIAYEATDPRIAAALANAVASAFVESNLERRMSRANEGLEWLAKRAKELEEQVAAAENAVQDFKAAEGTISLSEAKNIILDELRQLNTALTAAKTQRITAERTYREVDRVVKMGDSLSSLPPSMAGHGPFGEIIVQLGAARAELARLQERYLDEHPRVIRTKADIQALSGHLRAAGQDLLQRAKADWDLAAAREAGLQQALDEQEKKAMELDRKAIEYGILERQAETTRALYSALLQRMEEAGVAGTMESNNISVVRTATVPSAPSKPDKRRMVMAGIGLGFAIGIGLILLANAWDDRVKSQEDVENSLGIPFLGFVPLIDAKSDMKKHRYVIEEPRSTASEAFRTLRAALGFDEDTTKRKTILVTSAGPGEGKSLVATNLGLAYAKTGAKTLLVDGDLRRPALHRYLDADKEHGLSTFLVNGSSLEKIIQPTQVENLSVCTVGSHRQNPAEILDSDAMQRFLEAVTKEYDRIVIDSPPVGAVPDPLVVGRRADAVLLVVQFGKLRTPVVKRAVSRLQTAKARIIGGVVNKINVRPGSYNYYYYYGYYDYYYAEDGEKRRRKAGGKPRRRSSRRHSVPSESVASSSSTTQQPDNESP